MDRKFVFLLVVAVISISAKVNQKKKCREMCESNKYCKSWKYNEKTNKCKITIKKGDRRPRKSYPCETATKCEKMYESNKYCESWKFNEKSNICTMFFNPDIVLEQGCTQKVVTNICNSNEQPPIPTTVTIPPSVTPACLSIGEGLIRQYSCTHEAGDFSNPNQPNQPTCCRDVVLNLCNGSPEEVRNQTIRQDCIQNGYSDCLREKCSINCVEKVLTEMCGFGSSTIQNCLYATQLIVANTTAWANDRFGSCNTTDTIDICRDAVTYLCDEVNISNYPPTDEKICNKLGQNLCDTN